MNLKYEEYLKSENWYLKKEKVFEYKGHKKCEKCGNENNIQVHHSHYGSVGKEKLRLLFILCSNCHKLFHDMYGVKKDLVIETREFLGLPLKKDILIPKGLTEYIKNGGKFRKNPFTNSLRVWKKAKKN